MKSISIKIIRQNNPKTLDLSKNLLKESKDSRRRYTHKPSKSEQNNLMPHISITSPSRKKKRKGRFFRKAELVRRKPKDENDILCLCPNGRIMNMKYLTSKDKKEPSQKKKNLKILTEEMRKNKVVLYNQIIDKFANSYLRHSDETDRHKFACRLNQYKKPIPLHVLRPRVTEEKRSFDNEHDFEFEEVNRRRSFINKGRDNNSFGE